MSSAGTQFPKTVKDFSPVQRWALLILRIAIGWHFLYEGVVKLGDPNWTSAGYLAESKWIFSGIFHSIASNPTAPVLPLPPPRHPQTESVTWPTRPGERSNASVRTPSFARMDGHSPPPHAPRDPGTAAPRPIALESEACP